MDPVVVNEKSLSNKAKDRRAERRFIRSPKLLVAEMVEASH